MTTKDWLKEAEEDARDWVKDQLMDAIVEKVLDGETIDEDLLREDGQDTYHHETHVDKDYDLEEAAQVIDQLDEYEERDSGLWIGAEDFRKAAATCAAYTYGNAVYAMAKEILERINDNTDIILGAIHQDETVKDLCKEQVSGYLGDD